LGKKLMALFLAHAGGFAGTAFRSGQGRDRIWHPARRLMAALAKFPKREIIAFGVVAPVMAAGFHDNSM
jgi:hypothetical protein